MSSESLIRLSSQWK